MVAGAATVASLGAGAIAAAAGGAAAASGGASAGKWARRVVEHPARSLASVAASGAGGSGRRGTVPPPSSPPRGPSSSGRPTQPNPPSNGSGGAAAPSFASNGGIERHWGGANSAVNDTRRLSAVKGNRRLVKRQQHGLLCPPMGGESLAGSGFESERPAAGFSSTFGSSCSVSASGDLGRPGQGLLFGGQFRFGLAPQTMQPEPTGLRVCCSQARLRKCRRWESPEAVGRQPKPKPRLQEEGWPRVRGARRGVFRCSRPFARYSTAIWRTAYRCSSTCAAAEDADRPQRMI